MEVTLGKKFKTVITETDNLTRNKSRLFFSSAEMFKSSLFWVTLFASILNSSVMLGNYLQQTTSADDNFRCIFSWRFKG